MTSRNLYEGVLIELNKENAPNILLEDFNYFANKAINNYINKRYNIYDINQQTTDDLRVLKATALLTPRHIDDYKGLTMAGDNNMATYEVVMPSDYLHILNCICIYDVLKTYKCYNKGDTWRSAATRLTADMYSLVLDNFWMKPTYKRPYYYIHNVNTSNFVPTNPYGDRNFELKDLEEEVPYTYTTSLSDGWYKYSDDTMFRVKNLKIYCFVNNLNKFLALDDTRVGNETPNSTNVDIMPLDDTLVENYIQCYWSIVDERLTEIHIGSPFNLTLDISTSNYINVSDLRIIRNSLNLLDLGVDVSTISKNSQQYGSSHNKYSLDTNYGTDAFGNQIVQGEGLPRTLSFRHSDGTIETVSNIERGQALRYGNVSLVRLEIRYGSDNQVFKLKLVYVDYIKAPLNIRLTQQELDLTEDTSQILEYPDYVCQEIINELVHLIMENISDLRLKTHPVVSLSIANPAQALTPQAALGQAAQ